jgi:CubicO group peptidase (beta-lactamase class C family)
MHDHARMHTLFLRLAGTTTLLVLAAAAPAQQRQDQPGAERVATLAAQVLQRAAARDGFNGAVVLMRDGQVLYEGAVGLAERQPDRPFRPDTPSDGASLAKTLTAALVWERAQQGRLSLDDPVVRHLPGYPHRRHTVRDLVTHRNGLPDYDFFERDFAPGQPRDTADLLAVLARRKPADIRAPGIVTEYSNLGYDLAGQVVEQLDGRRLGALLRERFFAPLGMDGAFARPARFADWPGPRTRGYRRDGERWVDHDVADGEAHIGASNVYGSARDWARWGDAFARELALPREMLDAGLRQAIVASGMDSALTALSWYCDGARLRCHYTGHYNGFYSQVWWDRSRREVLAYVSNNTLAPWRCAALTREWIDALQGRESTLAEPPPALQLAAARRAALSGRYQAPGFGTLQLRLTPQRGWVRVGNGERATVFALPGGVFYAPTLELWLRFTGTTAAPVLYLQSVFQVGEARRQP